MPFNRADYYVQGPPSSLIPSRCAPNTGVLVKSIVSQSDGSMGSPLPLLDCVADLKVIFRLDTDKDGVIDYNTDVLNDKSTAAPLTAQQIRTQVKEIRIYILAQEGQMDNSFSYPSPTITVGEFGLGHTFTVGANVSLSMEGLHDRRVAEKHEAVIMKNTPVKPFFPSLPRPEPGCARDFLRPRRGPLRQTAWLREGLCPGPGADPVRGDARNRYRADLHDNLGHPVVGFAEEIPHRPRSRPRCFRRHDPGLRGPRKRSGCLHRSSPTV